MNMVTGILFSLAAGVIGAHMGSRWIDSLYGTSTDILSYPASTRERGRFRPTWMAALLVLLFSFTVLRHPNIMATNLFFLLAFEYFLLLFTFTDFEQQVIFDKMMLPFALLGCIATSVIGLPVLDHALAAAAGGAIFLLLAILRRNGIGGGDIKLIAALGLWIGTKPLTIVVMAGLVLAGIAALILLITGKKKRDETFAYGPYFTITAGFMTLL